KDNKDYNKLFDKALRKSRVNDYNSVEGLTIKWSQQHLETPVRKLKKQAKRHLNKKNRREAKEELRNY
ncbi:MAG: hypothetical protein N2738_07215, partial [Thermodesulfovibrionales bacterium]|nr:hypothetical protein [Thermodesulfovibrionales bacterium]